MVLSTPKFRGKVEQVMKLELESELENRPVHVKLEKHVKSGEDVSEKVVLGGPVEGDGGMMLYTSGTTNRPVSFSS
jgi:putative AlgH/UPF0301 family transcriptional regulator